jgi:regulator of RNase E activity RraA
MHGDVKQPDAKDRTFVRLPVRAKSDNCLHHAAGRDDPRNERVPAMKWIRIPYDRLQILALRANQLHPVPVEPFPVKQRSDPRKPWIVVCLTLLALLLYAGLILRLRAQDASHDATFYAKNPVEMLSGYRHVEVASVSDAEEQLFGQRMYMSHRMQSLFPAKFAGYALTVRLAKQENHDPDALNGMLEAIDSGKPDSVYVMSIEDGENIAGMGGLMGTAMSARNFSGAVIDGGVRDVAYLRKIGFPVYATGIVPSTSVGHYRFAGQNVSVTCDGVPVAPGDIIAADQDGVVVVPRKNAAEVLIRAQQLDFEEHSMYSWIEKLKSITAAVKQFHRL